MKWLVLVLALASPLHAQDAIDLSHATIVDAPDVSSWRQTASITKLTFSGYSTAIEFSKQWDPDRWPDVVPPGWKGPLQYTLWLCLQVDGQWVCSGFVQFWHGRMESGDPTQPDVPSRYHLNYYYTSRWRPMDGHGPIQPGERIGFLVTSGNARDAVGPYGPMERSNVVVVPATDVGVFSFAATSMPIPAPQPMPPPATPAPPLPSLPVPSVPPVQSIDISGLTALVQQLVATQHEMLEVEKSTNAEVTKVGLTFQHAMAVIGEWTAKIGIPLVTGLVVGNKAAK